jgi:hypothetical protein
MARSARPSVGASRHNPWPLRSLARLAPHARFPSWPGAPDSSTKRPKIRLQSLPSCDASRRPSRHQAGNRLPRSAGVVGSRVPARHRGPPPSHPLGSPRRTTAYRGTGGGLSRLPYGGSSGLDSPPPPAVPNDCADGGSSRFWKEHRGPPPTPSLTRGVQIGLAARLARDGAVADVCSCARYASATSDLNKGPLRALGWLPWRVVSAARGQSIRALHCHGTYI